MVGIDKLTPRDIAPGSSPKGGIARTDILLNSEAVNAEILLRILPDLRNRYALMADGEKIAEVDTLADAVLVRDRLNSQDLTLSQARAMLQAGADGEGELPSIERFDQ